jgi:hypothetical protein
MTESQILQGVLNETLFGCVEVDISVPNEWAKGFGKHTSLSPYEYFEEFSPLFCTTDVPFESWGELMQNYAISTHMSLKPRTLLVGGMKASQILLITPLLKWYIEHGLIVEKVYEVIQFRPDYPFNSFVQQVTDARRDGDLNSDLDVLSNSYKLLGNSAFGSLLRQVETDSDIKFVEGRDKVCKMVNSNNFKQLTVLDEEAEYFEVEMTKKQTVLKLPNILGFFILNYAKLRLLHFYYDFLAEFVSRELFSLIQCDTDSFYIALGGKTLEDVIKPAMRNKYSYLLNNFCHKESITVLYNSKEMFWFPRTCCSKHNKYDQRESGLFHIEFSRGKEMCALNSKTYVVEGEKNMKISCKGVNKKNVIDPLHIYKNVLKNKKSHSCVNKGFRLHKNNFFTYKQNKIGFSFFYVKREILRDGVHTKPLGIILKPKEKRLR